MATAAVASPGGEQHMHQPQQSQRKRRRQRQAKQAAPSTTMVSVRLTPEEREHSLAVLASFGFDEKFLRQRNIDIDAPRQLCRAGTMAATTDTGGKGKRKRSGLSAASRSSMSRSPRGRHHKRRASNHGEADRSDIGDSSDGGDDGDSGSDSDSDSGSGSDDTPNNARGRSGGCQRNTRDNARDSDSDNTRDAGSGCDSDDTSSPGHCATSNVASTAWRGQGSDCRQRWPAKVVPEDFEAFSDAVALDCEMVGVCRKRHAWETDHPTDRVHAATHTLLTGRERSALARVSVVATDGKVLVDVYVKPKAHHVVTDYRTQWSGIRPRDLLAGNGAVDFATARRRVFAAIRGRTLVGHALHHDFAVLGTSHVSCPAAVVIDTALYVPLRHDAEVALWSAPALRVLTARILNRTIQMEEHSSVEDAQACLDLFHRYSRRWHRDLLREQKQKQEAGSLSP
eukprot:m.46710 g.46710  ORF g.46710 m.46710 type:complete len:455 (+) comp11875_c0_seq2:38-1402(+)